MKIASAILLLLVSFTASAGSARRVAIHEVISNPASFVGRSIAMHGCLTHTPHGDFVERCGNTDWRNIIPALESNYDILPQAFNAVKANYSQKVEGDLHGTIVLKRIGASQHDPKYFFELSAITKPSVYEP